MKHLKKRILASLLAGALAAGTFATAGAPAVSAAGATLGYWPEPLPVGNQWYYQNETLQPYASCFQIDELKKWSPDNDPDARYNRSAVELADRWMGPNVNPLASRDATVMPLGLASARCSEAPSQGGDDTFVYTFNFYQYVDTFNCWGGASAEGPVAIPTPEVIDAAHRNGSKVTATIFLPWGDGAYGSQFVKEMLEKDENGNYIAADKLIEVAQYYGFDGYIFNAESGTGVAGFRDFLEYLQRNKPDNFTISWYNGRGSVSTSDINSWMQNGDTRITDEWWLDMSGSSSYSIDQSIASAQATGVSQWDIHSSWENWPMTGSAKGGDYHTRLDENGKLKISLGFLGSQDTLSKSSSIEDFMNVQDPTVWVGPTFDPTSTERPDGVFCGFASLLADETPIIGTEFTTTFTSGSGYKFYENGQVTGEEDGWYNRSLTDVLPTWRWIIDAEEDAQKLAAEIDFSDAWWGGTSLKFSGNLDANKANHIKLYSSQLDITDTTEFEITYKTPTDGVDMQLGLCFGEDYSDENFKFYDVETTANGEWTTAKVDLSGDAGKRAIAISLRFNAPEGVSDYAINVGRMSFTTEKETPTTVTGVTLDEVIYPDDDTLQARIYWDKAENTSEYVIHRVHPDGTREFVGATPSDAFYLGEYDRLDNEEAATFEITPTSEEGVAGTPTPFSIEWPEVPGDSFDHIPEMGENFALGQPAVSSSWTGEDVTVDKVNDGVIPNSKWCDTSGRGYAVIDLGENKEISRWVVYHANCRGAGESVDMNTVDFDFQYAPDDGQPLLTGDDAESKARVQALEFTKVDEVTGNKQNVTDRNLSEPINARYIKLNVTKSDNSAWHAIRVYEFEVYEEPGVLSVAAPTTPLARSVTVHNNEGATDTVTVDNVGMLYSSGTYGEHNGVIAENTGIVKLYDSLTAEEPIAQVKATQPDESYKQRQVGIASFKDLELNPEGGRLFYEILDESSGEILHSARYSVEYAPETGEAIAQPEATLEGSVRGFQLTEHVDSAAAPQYGLARQRYGILTLNNLPENAEVTVYDSAESDNPILHSNRAKNGTVTIPGVPLSTEGGTVYYEVNVSGRPTSDRFTVEYGDPMALTADLTGLQELIDRCDTKTEADSTSATWPAFAEALAAAKAVEDGADTATAEAARAALAEAYANLRGKASTQRLGEKAEEYLAQYPEENYTGTSYARFMEQVNNANAMVQSGDVDSLQVKKAEIALDAAVRNLVEDTGATVTGVTVDPATAELGHGATQVFTAAVTGEGDPSQAVTWTVSGNESPKTTINADGKLKVSREETATTLTVTATSKVDETKSATATVTVTEEIVEPDITVTIDPAELKVTADPGQKGQFTATVDGAEDDTTVTWSISGNTSEETLIENGQLFLGTDETATEMTVTATSNEDPDCMGTAKVIVVRSNKTLLQKTVDYANTLSTEGVTDSAKAYFEKVLAEAEAVLADGLAEQAAVDQAWDNLLEGIWGLGLVQGDKTMLEQIINRADAMIPDADKYVEANWQQLVDALAEAKAVYEDGDAMQGDVEAAADALLNAILAQRYKADKSILEDLINQAEGMDLSGYTQESVSVFNIALRAANAVLNDASLSIDDQKVVDDAAADLQSAIENLSANDNGSNTGDNNNNDDKNDSNNSNSDPNKGPMDDDKNPATGDTTPFVLAALLTAVAAAGVVLFRRRVCR